MKTFDEKQLREVMNMLMEESHDDFKDGVSAVADELGIKLRPRSFSIEGWAYADNVHRAITDKEIALYSHPSGTPPGGNSKETRIRLYPQIKQKFGELGWVGKKFKITVEEIFD